MAELMQRTQQIALPARPRVLVVDEDVDLHHVVRGYLRDYEVTTVISIGPALEELARRSHDAVLLDGTLSHADDAVAQIRAGGDPPPILMMSSAASLLRDVDRPGERPDDFIVKPFVHDALIGKIDRLLTAHAKRQQARLQRREIAELHERREADVDVARTIFDRIFLRGQFDRDTIRHLVIPADRLAGDAVFGAWASEDRYRWMLGDVTGHTLSSALITMLLAGAFYHFTLDGRSIEQLLRRLERELVAVLPSNMFCTGAMCELDRREGTLRAWNGGNPDILIRRISGEVTRIASTGVPLAADRFSEPSHPIVEVSVTRGDRILAFSDGLTEVRDRRGDLLGFDRLLEVASSGTAATVFSRLLGCIPENTNSLGGYDDDISLIEVIV